MKAKVYTFDEEQIKKFKAAAVADELTKDVEEKVEVNPVLPVCLPKGRLS